MPVSRTAFTRTTTILVTAALGALILIVAVSISLTLKTESNFEATQTARGARSAAVDLLSLMQEAETGQRGYLLSHDASYLGPYTRAVTNFDARLAALSAAVAGSPELAGRVNDLSGLLRAKMAELKKGVDLVQVGKYDDAMAVFATERGKRLMDAARDQFSALRARADEDLEARLGAQNAAVHLLNRVTILGAIAILAMAGGAVLTIMRYTGQLNAARSELETLNRELEERVRIRTDALAKANAEIQRFAYVVTHDLRSPLVNIMGFTGELEANLKAIGAWARAGASSPEAIRAEGEHALQIDAPEAVGFIRASTDKMDRLVKAILKISREGARALRPEAIDLDELLASAANVAHHQVALAGGEIGVDCLVGRVITDRLSLEQIVANLIDNAVKYRVPDRPLRLQIRARRQPMRGVAISFDDNGRGVAESDYGRIFDLFRRAGAQDVPGEGIGLAHVRTLVRNLGGEIVVESRLGAGSSFTVSLPSELRRTDREDAHEP